MKTKRTFSDVLSNGNTIRYREVESGTCYHEDTPEQVVDRLEDARINRYRIRIFLGDSKTGKDWNEEFETMGYVERSGGSIKVPLLIPNSRSLGGGSILDNCIVKIVVGRRTVYEVPGYNGGAYTIRDINPTYHNGRVYKAEVLRDGQPVANLQNRRAAERWVAFMKGERMTKGGR